MSGTQEAPPGSINTFLTTPKIVIDSVCDNDPPMDKYTAGIELSNACRQFYVTRLKAAGKVKERLGLTNGFNCKCDCTEETKDETKHTCNDATSNSGLAEPSPTGTGNKSTENKIPSKTKSNIEKKMNVLKYEMVSGC